MEWQNLPDSVHCSSLKLTALKKIINYETLKVSRYQQQGKLLLQGSAQIYCVLSKYLRKMSNFKTHFMKAPIRKCVFNEKFDCEILIYLLWGK